MLARVPGAGSALWLARTVMTSRTGSLINFVWATAQGAAATPAMSPSNRFLNVDGTRMSFEAANPMKVTRTGALRQLQDAPRIALLHQRVIDPRAVLALVLHGPLAALDHEDHEDVVLLVDP